MTIFDMFIGAVIGAIIGAIMIAVFVLIIGNAYCRPRKY